VVAAEDGRKWHHRWRHRVCFSGQKSWKYYFQCDFFLLTPFFWSVAAHPCAKKRQGRDAAGMRTSLGDSPQHALGPVHAAGLHSTGRSDAHPFEFQRALGFGAASERGAGGRGGMPRPRWWRKARGDRPGAVEGAQLSAVVNAPCCLGGGEGKEAGAGGGKATEYSSQQVSPLASLRPALWLLPNFFSPGAPRARYTSAHAYTRVTHAHAQYVLRAQLAITHLLTTPTHHTHTPHTHTHTQREGEREGERERERARAHTHTHKPWRITHRTHWRTSTIAHQLKCVRGCLRRSLSCTPFASY